MRKQIEFVLLVARMRTSEERNRDRWPVTAEKTLDDLIRQARNLRPNAEAMQKAEG